jgi:co-chaperonin GroES (HSP10)
MIRPLHDHDHDHDCDQLLAQRVEERARTDGGLFIPDNASEKPLEAVAASVASLMLTTEAAIAERSSQREAPH